MDLNDDKSDHMVSVATVDLLQDREGFTWKGHDRLTPRNGSLFFPSGFQTTMLIQCMPPAAVTAVSLHSEWNLAAFGTSHGFGLFDYHRRSPVLARYVSECMSLARSICPLVCCGCLPSSPLSSLIMHHAVSVPVLVLGTQRRLVF